MENQLATRAATKQIRLQHWRKVIQDRAESGLTVKEYCEQHNITKDSYYYWLRTVRETKAGAEASGMLYSIAETAKANNLKPYEYFKYLLQQILNHLDDDPSSYIPELLPWS